MFSAGVVGDPAIVDLVWVDADQVRTGSAASGDRAVTLCSA
jgi:hypothetical protein